MQAYYPSTAAHSHIITCTMHEEGMQAYHFSNTAHAFVDPSSMQAYYPSTAAHSHLNFVAVPEDTTPPPTPTAEELIASLQNPENLTDEELYERTLLAQNAMMKWQNEYLANDREIRRQTTGTMNRTNEPKARKLQDPKEYELARNKAEDELQNPPEFSSRGRKLTKPANVSAPQPAKQPKQKTSKPKVPALKGPPPPKPTRTKATPAPKTEPKGPPLPKSTKSAPIPAPKTEPAGPPPPKPTKSAPTPAPNPPAPSSSTAPSAPLPIPKSLQIDMNVTPASQNLGKRTRRPRKIFDALPSPTTGTKHTLDTEEEAGTDAAPPAKKRLATPAPSTITTRAATTTTTRAASKKRPHAPNEDDETTTAPPPAKKRAATEPAPPPKKRTPRIKQETNPRSKGEVMKEVWARRKAEGRNGRHGGAPKAVTLKKAALAEQGEV